MPWYKLPHADLVMHFDQEMDMEPADAPFATGGVVEGPSPKIGYPEGVVDEVVIPNAPQHWYWPKPKPKKETEAT